MQTLSTLRSVSRTHLIPQGARRTGGPTAAYRGHLRAVGVIGESEALATVLKQAALVAPLDVSVLLTGDTGTGKSQIARVIHDSGPRRSGPFIELNCAAVPDTLVESELFGALPGAHSTAFRRIEGKVAAAEHGTLLLDEIADLPLVAQGKLLQLLHSKEYFPLGSSRAVRANVRVIAATKIDLRAAVAAKRFREDLYYRLHVLPIRLPALSERRGDIPILVTHFAATVCERHGLERLTFSPTALAAAQVAAWPGNVRQLLHAVEAAAIRAAGDGTEQIERAHLFPEDGEPSGNSETLQEATRRFQAAFLQAALERADWNVSEVSRRLEVARSYLYELIHGLGLERPRSAELP